MHNSDKAIAEKDFFKNNKAAFDRWNIEWSDRTAALLNKAGAELNRSAVIDFFNGVVGEKVARQGALTAAWANDTVFLGQEGYDADKMHKELLKKGALLADSRISPKLPRNLPAFTKAFGSIAKANKVEASALFMLLHSTALKYTAGKYFRPGMVFALLF